MSTRSTRPLFPLLLLAWSTSGCAGAMPDIDQQFRASHNLLRHTTFVHLGPLTNSSITAGQQQSWPVQLEAGSCYLFAAFGGGTIGDLELRVSDSGAMQSVDEQDNAATAVVSLCAEQTGEYVVQVTSGSGSGPLRLAYWYGAERNQEGPRSANEIVPGRTVNGHLPAGQRYLEYSLTVPQRRTLVIDLESNDFDPFLYLLGQGRELDRNDDGGSGLNSRLVVTLDPGAYTIRVGSFADRGSGRFVLTVR